MFYIYIKLDIRHVIVRFTFRDARTNFIIRKLRTQNCFVQYNAIVNDKAFFNYTSVIFTICM